ncbi:hypothetical protein V8G54_018942 [Vigna mungo]|uniref:PA domain-containing protein n=1 Tax=Vigna mungo TaxID=3915 RepID=A0AAQ3RV82_VIGMU
MQTKTMSLPGLPMLLLLLFLIAAAAAAADNDAKRDDQRAPKSESCNNPFQLVKVENWIDGVEGRIYNGVTARFGSLLPEKPENSVRTPAIFSNPVDCCSNSTSKLSGSVALCIRGGCDFTVKAEFAQSGGATGMLIVNFELSIAVEILLYAPPRPLVDFSVAFLWLMSVGTIVCASLWSDFTSPEKTDERYNELCPKVGTCTPSGDVRNFNLSYITAINFDSQFCFVLLPVDFSESSIAETARDDFDKEIVNIDSKGAIIFVIAASTFLVLLFFFMSSWFVWVLIVLFCIGGIEVM